MKDRFTIEITYPLLQVSGRIEADRLFMLDQITLYLEAAKKPFPERLILIRNLEKGRYERAKYQGCFFGALRLIDYEGIMDIEAEYVARLRLCQSALACTRYKAKHGTFPRELTRLVPEFLPDPVQDPCDGNPLRLKVTDNSIILYSIGKDLTDNGGRPKTDWQPYNTPYDICFTLRN